MTRCSMNQIHEYLREYGWVYRVGGANVCYSGWVNGNREFTLKVSINETLVMFEVDLSPWVVVEKHQMGEIARFICEMNLQALMAKLTMDENNRLLLKTEALAHGFSFSHMDVILGILGHWADKLSCELVNKLNELGRCRSILSVFPDRREVVPSNS